MTLEAASEGPQSELLVQWARDLSTLLPEEIRPRWGDESRRAIDAIGSKYGLAGFEEQLADHNPLYYLAERVFFDNDPSLLWPALHRDTVCREFTDYCFLNKNADLAGLLLLIQRDSFKSTFSHGVLPLGFALRWKHLLGRDANILLTHHKESQASANLQRLKLKVQQHPWMRRVWPEFCVAPNEELGTKLGFDWPCKAAGRTSERSIMAAGMGARMTGYHFHLRINDDIVTEEHRDSKILRDEAFDKYTAMRFLRDTKESWEVNTGTPYHPNDLWSKLIKANVEGKPIYKSRLIGAHDETRCTGDDSTACLSFPTRHTHAYLEKIRQEEISRAFNDDYFQLQMLCRYRSTRMIAAQWEWMKACRLEDVPSSTYRVIVVDPAWKGTENSGEGDFASIQAWALEKRGSLVFRYLLDGYHSNELTDAEGRALIFELMRRFGVTDVAPEERGGKSFKQSLRNEALTRGVFINVLDLKSQQTNKSQRIVGFLGEAQAGRTYLCEGIESDLFEHFKDEFENYPQVDHDDALDAAAYINDTAVTERIVPSWNANTKPWYERARERRDERPRRTRYCLS